MARDWAAGLGQAAGLGLGGWLGGGRTGGWAAGPVAGLRAYFEGPLCRGADFAAVKVGALGGVGG